MSFKESVMADVRNVFLNDAEFADIRTVKYDGEVYADIPVVLTKLFQEDRGAASTDHMEGVHLASCTAHIALSDLGGVVPEQKRRIRISDGEALGQVFFQNYQIITTDVELGMIRMELEALDE